MLKAIHASADREAARVKTAQVVIKLWEMKLGAAAALVEASIEETWSYDDFLAEHQRTNNSLERLMRVIRRRTRVVGTFCNGNSTLILVCARLRQTPELWQTEALSA